jgi:16S rRNA (cytidine1402-2'-O)-methyltransferase
MSYFLINLLGMGMLYLIPVPLHEGDGMYLNAVIQNKVKTCFNVIAESVKMAKRHLNFYGHLQIQNVHIHILNEHTPEFERAVWIQDIKNHNHDWILMSDAGCPAIADPGTELVMEAHRYGLQVKTLGVPSAITMAVMLSGLSGQRFWFEGYLPAETLKRPSRIKFLERQSEKEHNAVFCIETPYRNASLVKDFLLHLKPQTRLFIGFHLGSSSELIKTQSISDWKRSNFAFKEKAPCVFGFKA